MIDNPSVVRFGEAITELFSDNRMVVFLCGPSLKMETPGAQLRERLKKALEDQDFEVVLGEDDGLEDVRLTVSKSYAHLNELAFIKKECAAIVLVADSVGSFCELGLFAHEQAVGGANNRDFVLLVNKDYEKDRSYFSEGPAKAIGDFGMVRYVDFATAEITDIVSRLERRRSVYFYDGRGRPAK
ncbi:hypothetical protein [Duganella sp. Dugasp56]|uniref:hypothetical protein n=1 Tax=Duganella sp. Dugasp56 TaxID=3243046 RepID=UPI0039AEBB42